MQFHLIAAAAPDPAQTAAQSAKAAAEQIVSTGDRLLDWMFAKGPYVLAALTMLIIAWLIAGWVRRLVIRAMTRAKIELTLAKFFGNLAKWALLLVAVIACLGSFGVNTTSFAAVLGAAGLAVGLALQGNLSNLAAGVLLLVFRPFKIGDAVIVAGQVGVVDGIDLFTTNLDTADNRRIIVPNNAVFSGIIENQTRHERRSVSVNVPVAASAGIAETESLLRSAADRVVSQGIGALADPPPAVALADIAPAVVWTVAVWTRTSQALAVRQALLREIKTTVDNAAIAPPPPAMNVRIDNAVAAGQR